MPPTIQEVLTNAWDETPEQKQMRAELQVGLTHLSELMVSAQLFPITRGGRRTYKYFDLVSGVVQYPEGNSDTVKAWLESEVTRIVDTDEFSTNRELMVQTTVSNPKSERTYIKGGERARAIIQLKDGKPYGDLLINGMTKEEFSSLSLEQQLSIVNGALTAVEHILHANPPQKHHPSGRLAVSTFVELG